MIKTTVSNRAILPEDLEREQEENQAIAAIVRMVEMTYEELRVTELDRMLQSAMTGGHLTSYFDRNRITLPDRVIVNRHMKSAWFLHADHMGLVDPCVLSFNFGREYSQKDLEEQAKPNQEEIEKVLRNMGAQAYLWCTSEKLTIFAARATGRNILPEDITDEDQESESGYYITPSSDPGKVGKRFRVISAAPGSLFTPQPSRFPELNLGGELAYRLGTRDSKTVGDGGLCCPEYVAKEIMRQSGAPQWGDIVAFQIVVIGADYSFKGLCNIVPNHLWKHPGIDLLVDEKSINRQVMNRKVTLGKVMPTRHKGNKKYFYVEPMNLGEVVNRFTDPDELAEFAMDIAQKVDRENWEHVMRSWREHRKRLDEIHTPGDLQDIMAEMNDPDGEWDMSSYTRQAKKKDREEIASLSLLYQESKGSPFGLTSLLDYLAAGPSNSWASQLGKSRRKGEQWAQEDGDSRKKSTLSGIMVSGEKLILMDPLYAGVTYPRKGYVRFVMHPKKPREIIGIGLAKSDTLELRDAFDGMDVDGDKVQMIPMRDENNRPHVFLMRSPMSVDGGAMLRLNLSDAKFLEDNGYHFYRQKGEHQYPGLYQIKDGKQTYPDVLKAVPHAVAPLWTTDTAGIALMERNLNRYKPVMGMVCLAAANLDYASLYDPKKHKFNMSEDVIDPSLNASADPSSVLGPLQDAILDAVRNRVTLDRCMFPRIAKPMRMMFRERFPEKVFDPVLDCSKHHRIWQKGQQGANNYLYQQNARRATMANGPVHWLSAKTSKKLLNLVVNAVEERMEMWKQEREDEKAIRMRKDIDGRQKDAMTSVLVRYAKDAEASLVRTAYRKAAETVDDLCDGEFIAAWIQASISRKQRFDRASRLGPVRASGLLKLPQQELLGYLNSGEPEPTVVIRAAGKFHELPGTRCFIEEPKEKKDHYWLVCEEDGQVITDLRIEARNYIGLELSFEGFMPEISITPQEGLKWEQTPNLMILRVTNPGKI